jgi:hypothetical protein
MMILLEDLHLFLNAKFSLERRLVQTKFMQYIVTYTHVARQRPKNEKTALARQRPANYNRGKVFSIGPREATVEELFGYVFSTSPC